jgi:dephospho-CoA kinase
MTEPDGRNGTVRDQPGGRARLRRWAVTGPAGAGKSLLCRFLSRQGAVVIDADALGHRILERPHVRRAVAETFGGGVIVAGIVDRRALGRIVFADEGALRALERLTHPELAAEIDRRLDALETARGVELAVVEAAVYHRLPLLAAIELVVAVLAPPHLRLRRLLAAGRLSEQEARQRMRAQERLAAGWSQADVVLSNEGSVADLELAASRLLAPHWPALAGAVGPLQPEEDER